MLALLNTPSGPQLLRVPVPRPGPGEALVRVRLAGVCATDLEIVKGYMGFHGILGHEFVGVVESLGSPRRSGEARIRPGQRVVGEINLPCGTCPTCRRGLENHCPRRTVLGIVGKDGVFAPYVTLPAANLHPVPDAVPDEAAVFTEPLAAALRILEQVEVKPGMRVAVLGDGRLGLLCAMVLARAAARTGESTGGPRAPRGASVTLVGRHPEKMRLVAPLGVRTVPARHRGALQRSFDLVVEATGRAEGWDTALALVRPRGIVVLKTTVHDQRPWNPSPLVIDEVTVVGSRCGPFQEALEWLEQGRVDPRALIAARYPLARAPEALREAARPGRLKVLIEP
jgi:threonine dehydrogenase-like Zn-dependent dehydrogenase